ncbi:TPA: hypothetical protein L4741_005631 [Pseudomonas aeruginosa]|uniref:Uncharacterized protein n=2 Tax=Pseudomonas TaxID=286 RepID=A0A6G6J7E4_PSENT|nr:hypothetical protein G5B91_33360 [Pseudomonas nitroreducens]HBO6306043.1 hypothetical protein [Pseudomonas aeruginosa]
MTQAFVPSLGSLPMLDALRRERSHGDLPGYLQVVQGIQVLLNYAGVVVTEVEEREASEVVLTLEREGVSTSLWLRPLERTQPGMAVFPLQVGAKFMACKPSATPAAECEVTFVYLPPTTTINELVEYAFGDLTYQQVESIQNFSAEYAMSGPIERFPRAALVMLMSSNTAADKPGKVYFKLWHQAEGKAELIELEPTVSPFKAAEQARDLGYSPTIYRCHSGCYVAFLSTSGFDFL